MAHYAFLDENNIVTEVIVGRNEDEVVNGISDWEEYYGKLRGQKCLRTSYNGNIRLNFAGVGAQYLPEHDVFLKVKPYPSWVLNSFWDWEAPIPMPETGNWVWVEEEGNWVEVVDPVV